MIVGDEASKYSFHFVDYGGPFFLRMRGLHINIICGMTDQTIGLSYFLTLTGLERIRICWEFKGPNGAGLLSSPGPWLRMYKESSYYNKEEKIIPRVHEKAILAW